MPNRKLELSTAPRHNAREWKNQEIYWQDFVKRLENPTVTQETVVEYQKMSKTQRDSVKDVGGYVAGYLKEGRRKRGYATKRSMITLDADSPSKDLWDDFVMLNGCAATLYSTHTHTPEKPRYRLIIPLQRVVTAEEYTPLALKIAEQLGLKNFDDTTYQPERLMYWPSHARDGEYIHEVQDGEWLDPEEVLSLYEDWTDSSSWPETSRERKVRNHKSDKLADPLKKRGIVGAFCKSYTVTEAIEEFLADVYESTRAKDRYTFKGGTTSAGLVIYDNDRFAYSNHATDPIGSQEVNAYDLVRIHRFGGSDVDEENTKGAKKKSESAMNDWARELPKVKATLSTEALGDFDEEVEDFEEAIEDPKDWLTIKSNGTPDINGNLLAKQVLKEIKVYYSDNDFSYYSPTKGIWRKNAEKFVESYIGRKKLGNLTRRVYLQEALKNIQTELYQENPMPDAPAHKIVLNDGIYNIQTGKFKKGFDPELHAITRHPIDYNPEAECPVFDGYLQEVVGKDQMTLIYEWMGFLFMGEYTLQKMLFIVGKGGTGKSTLLGLMQELVGVDATSAVTLEALVREPHSIPVLYGKTANFDADTKPEFLGDGATIKKLTGGDSIYANPKNEKQFWFKNKAKLTFSMNTLPPMSDHSGGLARRTIIIRMDNEVDDMIKDLYPLEEMHKELSGIFNKAMMAFRKALKRGKFTETKSTAKELHDWLEGNDVVAQFVKEACETGENISSEAKQLYRDFQAWADESGFRKVTKNKFYDRIYGLGYERSKKRVEGATQWVIQGLRSSGWGF